MWWCSIPTRSKTPPPTTNRTSMPRAFPGCWSTANRWWPTASPPTRYPAACCGDPATSPARPELTRIAVVRRTRLIVFRRRSRRAVVITPVRRRSVLHLVHAGVIGLVIIVADVPRRLARILRSDSRPGHQSGAGADGSACAGVTRGVADNSAQGAAGEQPAKGAVGLFVTGGLAWRDIARAGRRLVPAIAVTIRRRAIRLCGGGRGDQG